MPKTQTRKPTKEISGRRAAAGDLAFVLFVIIAALNITLFLAGIPLAYGGPTVGAGILATVWRLSGIRER